MKAVIMAGGEGTRLRPLTCDCPKPMARLCGRSVLEYILDLLASNGVTEAAVTLKYLPDAVRSHFPDDVYGGVGLHFVEEEKPLGTAGSVKNASAILDDDFIVISGDALCDFDLASAVRFHRQRGAAATLLLSHVADPREYGLVVTEPSGRVRGFVEKPGWAQAVTDAVNTGVYIISPSCLADIPDGKMFDFAKDLFPLLMRKGMPVYGYDADGYWCDIGDIAAYTACQFDMLDGRVDCRLPGVRREGVQICGALPVGEYRLMPPVYIGENVHIGTDAVIGPCAVLDDGCTVGAGATVKNSILLPDAYVSERCELRGALVCAGASVKKGAAMFEGSVAGAGAVVGSNAAVSPGVRIWPGKHVEDGARAAVNLKFGSARRGLFDDEGIVGEVGVELTPEFCARIGSAAASAAAELAGGGTLPPAVGIGRSGTELHVPGGAAEALSAALGAGLSAAGAQVCDFGACYESLFRFGVERMGLSMGIFVQASGSRAVLRLQDRDGLGLPRGAERKIDTAFSTGELRRCTAAEYRPSCPVEGMGMLYGRALMREAGAQLDGLRVQVKSAGREASRTLISALRALGCAVDTLGRGTTVRIQPAASGCEVSMADEEGAFLSDGRTLAVACLAAFESGEDVALPFAAPRILDGLALRYGRRVLRYLDCPADHTDAEARGLAAGQPWVRDGLLRAMRILGFMAREGVTLHALAAKLPAFSVAVKSVGCKGNPGNVLRALSAAVPAEEPRGPAEGVLFSTRDGRVLLSPLKRGAGLRIMAEAASMELANELCTEYERRLQDCVLGQGGRGQK